MRPVTARLQERLADPESSSRMQTALAAGTRPQDEYVEILIARCAVEPDFSVRDTLTWALTRHPPAITVPLLLTAARSGSDQARSQALHTLSKIGDPAGWAAITDESLRDPDDEVARSAWRAAVVLAPPDARTPLAAALATQLGRGGRDVRLSLSRALAALGAAADTVLAVAAAHEDDEIRTHALATQRLVSHPDEGFDASMFEARRAMALLEVPSGTDIPAPDLTMPDSSAGA